MEYSRRAKGRRHALLELTHPFPVERKLDSDPKSVSIVHRGRSTHAPLRLGKFEIIFAADGDVTL